MKHVRHVMFLAMVTLFMASGYQPVSMAALPGGASSVAVSMQDFCDDPEVCGPSEDCEKPCYVDLFENTCGGYGGVPVDPVEGNCLGECGDTYCNHYNGEDAETCWQDCGSCGDSVCSGPENMVGTEHYCCQDCYSNPTECVATGGGCVEHGECGMSEGCNGSGVCCGVGSMHSEEGCDSSCGYAEQCLQAGTAVWLCVRGGSACTG
ncbi:MAG: hypothetical protein WD227_11935 [Vicinamibacterales bacterium]